jgi:hypothetical protein
MTQLEHYPAIISTLAKRLDRIERELNQLRALSIMSGAGGAIGTYTLLKTVSKTGIVDNTATDIFTVTTVNETGSTDGGGFVCEVSSLCGHAIANDATSLAIMWEMAVCQRVNVADGTDYGAVAEIHEVAATESSGLTRGIASVTPGLVLTSNTVSTFQLTIDLDGLGVTTAQAVCFIKLIWYGYLTPPVIAAA